MPSQSSAADLLSQKRAKNRMRQNLALNAGISAPEVQNKQISARIYAQESTKLMKQQLAVVENEFNKIQNLLRNYGLQRENGEAGNHNPGSGRGGLLTKS